MRLKSESNSVVMVGSRTQQNLPTQINANGTVINFFGHIGNGGLNFFTDGSLGSWVRISGGQRRENFWKRARRDCKWKERNLSAAVNFFLPRMVG